MITLSNVSVGYGRTPILGAVSFGAESGQITVILGKNGCGKSTLLRAVSGTLRYSGSIEIDGVELSKLSPKSRARKIAVMPQMMHAPGMTVRELVSCGRQPYTGRFGVLSEGDRSTVEGALAGANLQALADKRVDCISGGERQRAYFAMLLAQDTENVMLDEPVAHLDAEQSRQLSEFLKSMAKSGKTVIAVLHDLNRAIALADRIVFIDSSSILFCGSPDAFVASGIPERLLGLERIECKGGAGQRTIFL